MKIIVIFLILAGLVTIGIVYLGKEHIIFDTEKTDQEHREAIFMILDNKLVELESDFNKISSNVQNLSDADIKKYQQLSRNINALQAMLDEMDYTNDVARWKILRRKFSAGYNNALRTYKELAKK